MKSQLGGLDSYANPGTISPVGEGARRSATQGAAAATLPSKRVTRNNIFKFQIRR